MLPDLFHKAVQYQMDKSLEVLKVKGDEYAENQSDKLHNFRVAGALQQEPMRQALAGMMAKHSVSLYDMLHSGSWYPISVWEEKITDHINYLLILRAILEEEGATPND